MFEGPGEGESGGGLGADPAATGSAAGAAGIRACLSVLTGLPRPSTEAEAVDRIRSLEELKSACAAAQGRTTAALHGLRTEAEAEQGIPARDRGRGLAAEVALARRESPNTGSRDLGLARALCEEMPHTLAALTRGVISEWKATIMCRETAWLPVEARHQVDELMADRLEDLGAKKLAGVARAHAQRLDQASAVEQMNRSERERRVSVRPAPGGMAYLTALLPMAHAVGCLGSLKTSAATTIGTGERSGRTQDQIMADLLVERITGQAKAEDVPVEIHLVMTDRSLWGATEVNTARDPSGEDPNDPASGSVTPAWLVGHGPLPAEVARRVITDSEAEVFIRRLYTEPTSGQLVAMDSARRTFSGALRRMILVRDDTCRTPYCDAPVKHVDHVTPFRDGGATSAANASGLCARCNYTKENPAWSHTADGDRLAVTTPTGHRYTVRTPPLVAGAPPAPGAGPPAVASGNRPLQSERGPTGLGCLPTEGLTAPRPGLPPEVRPDRAWRPQPDPVLGHVSFWPANSVLEQAVIQLLMATAVARRAGAD
ncbi:DUF222 domain-containing protein [Citricoccus nitrophenolicus]|uniref:HNH endonuclease n=1 Tax=Citricoccus nitrophenolicus TaxID=863575 RepID=UPI0039B55BDC